MNGDHMKTPLGILKAIGLVLCLTSAIMECIAYFMSPYHKLCWENGSLPAPLPSVDSTVSDPASDDLAPVLWMERFQISTTWMGFIISAILLILSLLSQRLYYNKIFKAVNFGFYFVFSVLLITSAIFVAYAAFDIDRKICKNYYEDMSDCQQYKLKMASAGLTLLTGVVYVVTSAKVVATKLYEEV